jgi:FMN phosphatase YigB (HAD superfamily)
MVKVVLFDLFETLITESSNAPYGGPTRASALAGVLGLDEQAYRAAWKARRPRIVVGELSFAEALTEISRTLSGRVDAAAIQQVCQQRIKEKAAAYADVDPQVTALVTELVRRGVGLGVISNGFKEDVLPWSACTIAPAFHCQLFSCEEGIAKPDPEPELAGREEVLKLMAAG